MFDIIKIQLLLYVTFFLFEEALTKNKTCPGKLKTTYIKKTVMTNLVYPRGFAIDQGINTLYFSHGKEGQLARVHLETKIFTNIDNIESLSQTVNPITHEVYIAPEKGIFRYDPKVKVIDIVMEDGGSISSLFYFNHALYFTEPWLSHVHKVVGDRVEMAGEIKLQKHDYFVVDHNGTFFYTFENKLYSNAGGVSVSYQDTDELFYNGLAVDNNGEVLACTYFGIYHVNKNNATLERIVTDGTKYCSGLAIDKKNNIVYANGKSIFKLKKATVCIILKRPHKPKELVTAMPIKTYNNTSKQ